MKLKKYIIVGILVFMFSSVAIYLVLDDKKSTYAIDAVAQLCTANGHGHMSGNKCVCDAGYSITSSEEATCQKFTLTKEFFSDSNIDLENDDFIGRIIISWNSAYQSEETCSYVGGEFMYHGDDMNCSTTVYNGAVILPEMRDIRYFFYPASREDLCYSGFVYDANRTVCYYYRPYVFAYTSGGYGAQILGFDERGLSENYCKNTIGWTNARVTGEEVGNSNGTSIQCVVDVTDNGTKLYYPAKNALYCDRGYTYNSSDKRCEYVYASTLYRINYSCGENITCDDMPEPSFTESESNRLPISPMTPTRSGYTFDYWYVKNGTKHYYHSCSQAPGKNDSLCLDMLTMNNSTTTTLLAHWTKTSSGGSGGTSGNPTLKYDCGNKDCDTSTLPSTQTASSSSGGTLNISSTTPKATDSSYEFKYWTSNASNYIYHNTCSGLSNCKTQITITKNNTLHAYFAKKTGGTTSEDKIYVTYDCGQYDDNDISCNGLPGRGEAAEGGKVYIPSSTPTTKNLNFLYWTKSDSNTTYCADTTKCDYNYIIIGENTKLYANWQPKTVTSTGNYVIKYICDEGDCDEIEDTTSTISPLTITSKIPTRDGYTFLYWQPGTGYIGKYCNPANSELDCIKNMWFTSDGTIRVIAVWMKDDDSGKPDESTPDESTPDESTPDNSESQNQNNGDNPGTGGSTTYVAIILCMAMLGYSYYYFRKVKEN